MTTGPTARCDYLLMTALDDEQAALHGALRSLADDDPIRLRVSGAPTLFTWRISNPFGMLSVFTTSLTAMGNEASAESLRLLLDKVRATYVGLVGIAGAASQTIPAQILIADEVWHYEPAKIREPSPEYRGLSYRPGMLMVDRLKHLDLTLAEKLFPLVDWRKPVVGTIASGDKVIAAEEYRNSIRDAKRNVVGFEMEGYGFARVAGRIGTDQWFMIRSVQDSADAAKSDEYREAACRAAAAYAATFIMDCDLIIPSSPPMVGEPEDATPTVDGGAAHELRRFSLAVSRRLLRADPQSLLEELSASQSAVEHADPEWALLTAEAALRSNDPQSCTNASANFVCELVSSRDRLLNNTEAQLMRLNAWGEWRIGNPQKASDLLRHHLNRVNDLGERGRWADLIATVRRHDEHESWESAVAFYQQAVSLKEDAADWLGLAMTLQNIAFTYIEQLDWSHARHYLRLLILHTEKHSYDGEYVSACLGYLGLAWIDLMSGGIAELSAARKYLQMAGEMFRSHRIPNELGRAAKALAVMNRERRGHPAQVPAGSQPFWARLILAQVHAMQRAPTDQVIRDLTDGTALTLLARHRLRDLVECCAPSRRASAGSNAEGPAEPHGPWPLRTWLVDGLLDPKRAMQFLEGIAHLYAAVLSAAAPTGGLPSGSPRSARAKYISDWAAAHPKHPLAHEAKVLGAVLFAAAPARNKLAHATPGEDLHDAEYRIVQSARRAADEAQTLRAAEWVTLAPPTLLVAGMRLDMSDTFRISAPGRLAFVVDGATVDTEPEG